MEESCSSDSTERADFLLGMMRKLATVRDPMEVINTFVSGVKTAYKPNAVIYLSTRGLPSGRYRVLRFQSAGGEHQIPPLSPSTPLSEAPVRRGGILGTICAERRSFIGNPSQMPDSTDLASLLAPYRIAIASPIETSDWWMDWVILLHEDPNKLTINNLEDLVMQANLLGTVIANIETTRELARANQRIEKEVAEIARIQRALLPEGAPKIPGLQIACSYETAVQAGGDLYDFIPLDEQRWGLIVADAAGHGPAAAVVAAMVSTLFRALPAGEGGPAELLKQMNCRLNERRFETSLVTAFAAVYVPETRRFVYSRAGHNPPLLIDGAEVSDLRGAGGLPLGIMSEAAYEDQEVQLNRGQTLVLYTDGITEAGISVESQFGTEGLARSLRKSGGSPVSVVEQIMADVAERQGGHPRKDDQTLVVIRVD